MRVFVCAVLALFAAASVLGHVRAQEADSSPIYARVLDDAIAAFKARQWTKARTLFERAHEISPSARTLRGIGVTAFEGGEYAAAIHALEAALVHPEKQLPPDLREGTAALIGQAREHVNRVELVLEPRGAEVQCDDRVIPREPDGALLLDLGVHRLVFEAPGFVRAERSLTVNRDQSITLDVTLAHEAPGPGSNDVARVSDAITRVPLLPRAQLVDRQANRGPLRAPAPPVSSDGRRITAYGTLLVSVAALATSMALLTRGHNLNEELHDTCDGQPDGCPRDYAESGQATIERYERSFGATLAVASGAGLASAVLWTRELIERRRERRSRDVE